MRTEMKRMKFVDDFDWFCFFIIIFYYFYCKPFRKIHECNYVRWFLEQSICRVCFVLRVNSTVLCNCCMLFNLTASTDGNRLYSHSYMVDSCLESKRNSHELKLKLKFRKYLQIFSLTVEWYCLLSLSFIVLSKKWLKFNFILINSTSIDIKMVYLCRIRTYT